MIIKMLYLDQNDESRIWQPSRPALLKLSRETTKTFPCHHSSTLVTLFFFRTNTKFEPPVFLTIVVLALNHPNVFVISSYLPIEIFVKFVFPICPFALVGMLSTNFRRVMIELSILFISILTPYNIVFNRDKLSSSIENISDYIFMFDLLLQFNIGYYDKKNDEIILDRSKIANH